MGSEMSSNRNGPLVKPILLLALTATLALAVVSRAAASCAFPPGKSAYVTGYMKRAAFDSYTCRNAQPRYTAQRNPQDYNIISGYLLDGYKQVVCTVRPSGLKIAFTSHLDQYGRCVASIKRIR